MIHFGYTSMHIVNSHGLVVNVSFLAVSGVSNQAVEYACWWTLICVVTFLVPTSWGSRKVDKMMPGLSFRRPHAGKHQTGVKKRLSFHVHGYVRGLPTVI